MVIQAVACVAQLELPVSLGIFFFYIFAYIPTKRIWCFRKLNALGWNAANSGNLTSFLTCD